MGAVRVAAGAEFVQFLRKAMVLVSVVAGALMSPAEALAGFGYVTHWTRFDTSGVNALFNGPTDVAFLKSNGNMLIVDSNAGVCSAPSCAAVGAAPPTVGEVVIQQQDGTYVGFVTPNNNSGPVRVVVDPNSGDVYTSTYYDAKIRRYTEVGGALTLANTWTGCTANGGNGPYNWGKTFGVASDSTGAIYVNDYDNLRIIKMNTAGQCLAAPLTTYTKNGSAGQVFLNLTGIAVDSADNVWVADYGKKVLVKYNSAGVWQTTLTGFSNCGTTTTFSSPKDIDIDLATNEMFITEGGGANSGVIKLDSSGNFLSKATKYNTNTTFASPFGGGFTSGFFYATDYGHSAVVKYQNPTRKVSVTASANGTVAADVGGIITGTTGGNTCVDQFVDATTVVLTATPASGYAVTWGGADGAGCTGNTCTLSSIAASKLVTATFTLANAAPTATGVAISGTARVGTALTGSYTYSDAESDAEATTTFRWVRNSVNTGIGGGSDVATTQNYTPVSGDAGKYMYFCVTPVASAGTATGAEVCSNATAAVQTIEDPVPNASGSGTGDGNGDGILDSTQVNVASLPTSAGGGYATIVSVNGRTLASVTAIPKPADAPASANAVFGAFSFIATGVPATAEPFELYIPYNPAINAALKKNRLTGQWDNVATSITQIGTTKTKITFLLTDGGPYDADGVVNAQIQDPIIPVVLASSGIPTLSEWGIITLSSLMALFGVAQVRRRKGAGYSLS
jgi:hypothetical protein